MPFISSFRKTKSNTPIDVDPPTSKPDSEDLFQRAAAAAPTTTTSASPSFVVKSPVPPAKHGTPASALMGVDNSIRASPAPSFGSAKGAGSSYIEKYQSYADDGVVMDMPTYYENLITRPFDGLSERVNDKLAKLLAQMGEPDVRNKVR